MMMIMFKSWSMMMVLITMLLIRMWWWWWSKGQSVEDVAADRKVKVLKMCCWSKDQSAEDVADQKVKVLKMLLLIERSKCWRCCWRCCWSKDQSVEDVADEKVKRYWCWLKSCCRQILKTKTIWCWKASNDLYMCYPDDVDDVLSYYCCCWCFCRIPFSLRGSVEIL